MICHHGRLGEDVLWTLGETVASVCTLSCTEGCVVGAPVLLAPPALLLPPLLQATLPCQQIHPISTLQTDEQPSKSTVLPSSHASPGSRTQLPQTAEDAEDSDEAALLEPPDPADEAELPKLDAEDTEAALLEPPEVVDEADEEQFAAAMSLPAASDAMSFELSAVL